MAKRLTYTEDGSTLWSVITSFAAGNQTLISTANKNILNGDQSATASYLELISSANQFSGILHQFAKAANVREIFISYLYNSVTGTPSITFLVEASADSTDGNDGTWTTILTESQQQLASASQTRIRIKIQTEDEDVITYTWLRVSWSASSSLNNLRVMSYWIYAEYDDPPYDFYDVGGVVKMQVGETFLGAHAGNAAVAKTWRFRIKNNESSSRTYTLTFAKAKVASDTAFASHVQLSTDGSTKASFINLTVAAGVFGDFYLHLDIPVYGAANGNPQDAALHYGKITIAATGVTDLPGFFIAVFYDTIANIELLTGTGLTNICLVYQRDLTDEGEIAGWSWWDVYGVASCVQQETVGNDITLVLDSSGYVWEMDRNEFDNEEFAPAPVLMVIETVESPAKQDPHIWRRNMYFDFDVEGADPGVLATYILKAINGKEVNETSQDIEIANAGMRVGVLDVGFQFRHRLEVYTGGAFDIKNYGHHYQNLTDRGRLPYVAGV